MTYNVLKLVTVKQVSLILLQGPMRLRYLDVRHGSVQTLSCIFESVEVTPRWGMGAFSATLYLRVSPGGGPCSLRTRPTTASGIVR